MAKTPQHPEPVVVDEAEVVGKGRPTPSRREREAANLRPLVSNDRKTANKEARAKMAVTRERARVGMANGEEKYLQVRDRGPQRRFVRDYVDSRWNVGELMIPVMFLVILTTFIPGIEVYAFIGLWMFVILAVGDSFLLGSLVKRRVAARFGEVQRGTAWYAAMRGLQLRPMRLPKPQVRRGQRPE